MTSRKKLDSNNCEKMKLPTIDFMNSESITVYNLFYVSDYKNEIQETQWK